MPEIRRCRGCATPPRRSRGGVALSIRRRISLGRRIAVPFHDPMVKTGWFVSLIRATSARGQATRARRLVALAAFQPCRDVHFVDFDRSNEIELRRVQRSGKALDAAVHRLVGHTNLSLKLANTRVEPQERVDREQPLAERNLRVSENCARLIVERAVAILTEIALKRPIAAVSDRPVRTAAGAGNAVTPANLLEQVRCERFRAKHIERNHSCRTPLTRCPCPFRFQSHAKLYQQSPTEERT